MNIVGLLGILAALVFLIVLVYKGLPPLIVAPLSAIIIAVTNGLGVTEGYTQVYMSGLGTFAINNLPIFLWGAIFGELYSISGAAKSIANSIAKIFKGNKDHVSPLTSILVVFAAGTLMA